MRPSARSLGILGLAFLGGCIEFPDLSDLGEAGMDTGPCVEDECFSGLACIQGVCVPDPEADGDPSASSGSLPSDDDDDDDDSASSASESASTTGSDSDPSATATQSGSGPDDSDSDDSDDSSDSWSETDTWGSGESDSDSSATGIGFISDPDGGGVSIECDIWEQDCPAGEKCNAWANDGGNSWNATRCVPVSAFPASVGQSCDVEGSGVSGVDTCDEGAICWDVDAETNVGTCEAYCDGSPANPVCGFGMTCVTTNSSVLALCLPACDPIVQGCPTP